MKKTLRDFYEEVFHTDVRHWDTVEYGTIWAKFYHFSFQINEYTVIYCTEMHMFPYPTLKESNHD